MYSGHFAQICPTSALQQYFFLCPPAPSSHIFQVHEVNEHIKINHSILEFEDLKSRVNILETQVKELKAESLKNSQRN